MASTFILAALVAVAEARFGQEQTPVAPVAALTAFGQPGQAGSLGGAVPGVLLAAADPCAKLKLGDQIVSELGTDPQVLSAAIGVVAAEQNFNPFVVSIPAICGDPTLPATQSLRGIVPLIDPSVVGSDIENANSNKSVKAPFSATGMSVAQVMQAQGFSNFTIKTGTSSSAAPAAASSTAAAQATAASVSSGSSCSGGSSAGSASSDSNGAASSAAPATPAASTAASTNQTASTLSTDANTQRSGSIKSSLVGVDFGKCTPKMDFQLGRPGRKATEGTFLPTDPLVLGGQQDALNPNIITNEICNQLTNVCDANQAAKDACTAAKAVVAALTTKDQSTADAFSKALGI